MTKYAIIRKIGPNKYRLYSKKKDPQTGKRKNLGTFDSLKEVKKREQEVQYFKQNAEDGKTEGKCNKVVKLMSDMAGYLEDAGFVDASQNVYDAMCAVDGSFADDTDYAYDMASSIPDVQNALPGSVPYEMTGEVAGGMQGTFSIPEGTRGSIRHSLVSLANHLDQIGRYAEATELDRMASDMDEIINDLEKSRKDIKNKKVEPEEKEKAGVGEIVDSNGHIGTSVEQGAGWSGLSDAYFYRPSGSIESNL